MKIKIMKKIIQIALVSCTYLVFLQGCKKEEIVSSGNSPIEEFVIKEELPKILMAEEFVSMENLLKSDWLVFNNSIDASDGAWQQGFYEEDGQGGYLGFKAYSSPINDVGEYAFVGQTSFLLMSVISSWLVTPPLELKNGDTFSFYTRCHKNIIAPHKLEVRLTEDVNPTAGTKPKHIGSFTQLLQTVNEKSTLDGYPQTWEKIDVTISGLTPNSKARIAFRYMSQGQVNGGIGIDQLVFNSK
jgi:hypothetical protein